MIAIRKRAAGLSGIRRLLVYSRSSARAWRRYVVLPEIRLHGEWLRRSGFESGQEIMVVCSRNRLVITTTTVAGM